jgi:hypothetical protein
VPKKTNNEKIHVEAILFENFRKHLLARYTAARCCNNFLIRCCSVQGQKFFLTFQVSQISWILHLLLSLLEEMSIPRSPTCPTQTETETDTCTICLENVNPRGGQFICSPGCCGKWFHQRCIENLKKTGKNICPCCVQPFPSGETGTNAENVSDQMVEETPEVFILLGKYYKYAETSVEFIDNERQLRNLIINELSENGMWDRDEEEDEDEDLDTLIERLLTLGEEIIEKQRGSGYYGCIKVDRIQESWGI